METERCILVIGSSGSGKSTLVQHLTLDLMRKGYNISIAKEPNDIVYTNQKQVFVLEDPFGNNSILTDKVKLWDKELKTLKTIIRSSGSSERKVVLISCRLNIYKNKQLNQIKEQLEMKECNICSETLCLTQDEKREMFKSYVKVDVNFDQIRHEYEYFPLICGLSKNEINPELVKQIFRNPPAHIHYEIEKMKYHNKNYFFLICLCVMFDKGFRKRWLQNWSIEIESNFEFKKIIKRVSDNIYNPTYLESELARGEIMEALGELEGSYCTLVGDDIVTLVHDKVYDIAAKECGQSLFSTFLANAKPKFIKERYIFTQGTDMPIENKFLITIGTDTKLREYFGRVLEEIRNESINIMEVSLLNNELAQTHFVNYIIETDQLRSIESAGQSPLCLAVRSEYVKLVIKLLEHRAKISICEETPLFIAVDNNNEELVSILLKHGALSDDGNDEYEYEDPFVRAVENDNTDILLLLLEHPDCPYPEWGDDGSTPLVTAAENNNIAIVHALLNTGADANCDDDGQTPLLAAVENNNIDIARILLDAGVDANYSNGRGDPLEIAVTFKSFAMVCLLKRYGADQSLCDNPLLREGSLYDWCIDE